MKTIHALRFATLIAFAATFSLLTSVSQGRTLIWTGAVSGTWDLGTTANWSDNGAATTFANGDTAIFDDTSSGTPCISIAAGGVAPAVVNVSNGAKNYKFTGPGALGGAAVVNKTGIGTLVIGCPQTYSVLNMNAGTTILETPLPNATINAANGAILHSCANNSGSTISVAGVATFYSSQTLAALHVADGGTAKVATAPVKWGRTLDTTALTIAPTGQLNLTNNAMIARGGNLTTITSSLATGLNSATWDGFGINSSCAAADASVNQSTALGVLDNAEVGYPTFSGIGLTGSEILVAYTFYGDANLDCVVDAEDYALTDFGFNTAAGAWLFGDFDYSGSVDGTDYLLIDIAFGSQATIPPCLPEFCPVIEFPCNLLPTQCHYVAATCFSGTANGTAPNAPGPVVGIIDASAAELAAAGIGLPSGAYPWKMDHNEAHPSDTWTRAHLGEVFGLTMGDGDHPAIFVTGTSVYSPLSLANPAGITRGEVWRLDGIDGHITKLATLPQSVTAQGAGLGNVCFTRSSSGQPWLYASNLDDGLIYRLDPATGSIQGTFDHGMQGLPAIGLPQIGPDAAALPFTQPGRRVWAVQGYMERLYYGVWNPTGQLHEVWSVGLDANGAFKAGTARRTATLIGGTNPPSDISFSKEGKMVVAERYHFGAGWGGPHYGRVWEFTGGPASCLQIGTWQGDPNKFLVGAYSVHKNSAGGVAVAPDGSVWASGDALDLYVPGGHTVYGLQHMPPGGTNPNVIGTSHLVDLNGASGTSDKRQIGDVEICNDCMQVLNPVFTTTPLPGGGYTRQWQATIVNHTDKIVVGIAATLGAGSPAGVAVSPQVTPVNLTPGASTTLTLTITGAAPGQTIALEITLLGTNGVCCRQCVAVNIPGTECVSVAWTTVGGQPAFTLTIRNVTSVPISKLTLIPQSPATASFQPSNFTLSPALAPGATRTIGPIAVFGAPAGSALSFTIATLTPLPCQFTDCVVTVPAVAPTPEPGSILPSPTVDSAFAIGDRLVANVPACAILYRPQIVCDPTQADCYTYTVSIQNLSAYPFTQLVLDRPESGSVVFSPPLQPGQSRRVSVKVCGPAGTTQPLRFVLLDTTGRNCCEITGSVVLPECECGSIRSQTITCIPCPPGTPAGIACYRFTFTVRNSSGQRLTDAFFLPSTPGLTVVGNPVLTLSSPPDWDSGENITLTGTISAPETLRTAVIQMFIHNLGISGGPGNPGWYCCDFFKPIDLPVCCDCDETYTFVSNGPVIPPLPANMVTMNLTRDGQGKLGFDPDNRPRPFPYVWMAESNTGTMVRIDVNTGQIKGRYRTAPNANASPNPSRTTVDRFGECWVGNRGDNNDPDGSGPRGIEGSVTRVGLLIGGTRGNKTSGGFVANADGQYLQPPFTYISPSVVDRDGDGLIHTAMPTAANPNQFAALPWSGAANANTASAATIPVIAAADELITNFARVTARGVRALAVDRKDDLWVGGNGDGNNGTNVFIHKVSGSSGLPLFSRNASPAYGAVINPNNELWLADKINGKLARWSLAALDAGTTAAITPVLDTPNIYGIGIDPCTGLVSTSTITAMRVRQHNLSGTKVADILGESAQGLCVDHTGRVWVSRVYANTNPGVDAYDVNPVTHILTGARTYIHHNAANTIQIKGSTGVAVDTNGNIWASDRGFPEPPHLIIGDSAIRINGTTKQPDLKVPLLADSRPYNYSDKTGYIGISSTGAFGFMEAMHDSGCPNTRWGRVTWEAQGTNNTDCTIKVYVRAANDQLSLGSRTWQRVGNGGWLCSPFSFNTVAGRFLQVKVEFQRPALCPPGCDPRLCWLRVECCDHFVDDINLPTGDIRGDLTFHDPGTLPVVVPISGTVLTSLDEPVSVEWLVDGVIVSTLTASSGPLELLHAFGDGIHEVTLRLTAGDQISESTTRVEIGDHTPPQFLPVPLQQVTAFGGSIPNFLATVQVFDPDGSADPLPVVTQGIPAGTIVGPGLHEVPLTATDAAGNVTVVRASYLVAPVVTLTSPSNYDSFPAETAIPVSYSVAAGVTGITSVVLEANGVIVATLPGPGVPSTVTLAPGEHSLRVVASGPGGAVSQGYEIGVTVRPPVSLPFSGTLHTALGAATLTPVGADLQIANLGSSGQDGVSIAVGGVARAGIALSAAGIGNGAFIELGARGSVNGVASQALGNLQVTMTADGVTLLPDFSPIGASTYRLQIFNPSGVLVVDLPGFSGTFPTHVSTMPAQIAALSGGFIASYPPGTTFPASAIVGGAPVNVGEVRLLPEGSFAAIDYLSSVELRASGIPAITITGETLTPLPAPILQLTCIGATFQLDLGPTVPNFRYRFEASTDLANWTPIETITAPGLTLSVDVPAAFATGSSRWFYRTQVLPPQ